MGGRWNLFRLQLHGVLCVVLMLHLKIEESWSLNLEGLALLEFRAKVESDPYDVFSSWNPDDEDPCMWPRVHCWDGKVDMLDLKELSLGGTLAPELGELSHMRALVLYMNHFYGAIPKEIGKLNMLELLDLRSNNLNGTIPAEIGNMLCLKHLLLSDNEFQGGIPPKLGELDMLPELQYDQHLTQIRTGCMSRKLGLRLGQDFSHGQSEKFSQNLSSEEILSIGSTEPYVLQSVHRVVNSFHRRLLQESHNLPADPVAEAPLADGNNIPSVGSGSFLAVPNPTGKRTHQSPPPGSSASPANPPSHVPSGDSSSGAATPAISAAKPQDSSNNQEASSNGSGKKWKYVLVLPGVGFLLVVATAMLFMCRSRGVATIGPWKSGLSGQLQKAFVTGVPKLNRSELETACEQFSNIIGSLPDCTLFKGTLSSGVEIAVTSATVSSSKDWSKRSEIYFRRKIDTLSRLNHKNFVNLLGYCEEEEPFDRMMVFEYAPNGDLFEHLHVKDVEHLDWTARMRIIMGVAYCLQYMHHELNPPVAHPNLQSSSVYLTDDFAAKLADFSFRKEAGTRKKISGDDDMDPSDSPSVDTESNVYNFGILLLEIISGKLPYSEELGSLVNWAVDYLNEKRNISCLVDPMLKSFKNNELDIVCEVIQECIHPDPKQRPTMRDITSKLREVIGISPDAATPRLSPLWWAELEILSVEAS